MGFLPSLCGAKYVTTTSIGARGPCSESSNSVRIGGIVMAIHGGARRSVAQINVPVPVLQGRLRQTQHATISSRSSFWEMWQLQDSKFRKIPCFKPTAGSDECHWPSVCVRVCCSGEPVCWHTKRIIGRVLPRTRLGTAHDTPPTYTCKHHTNSLTPSPSMTSLFFPHRI